VYLAFAFAINHTVEVAVRPEPDKDNKMDRDWSELQILSTLDYATDSWWCTFATGSLNHQTAHHLFPGISQYYYPIITPIVKQTCKDFGIDYHSTSGFLTV
jgi:fatty acid desaturase